MRLQRLFVRCCFRGRTYLLPAVEVHAGQFAVVGLCNVDVQRLALVDEGAAVRRHLDDGLLGDFPHSFIQLLHIVRNSVNVLENTERNICYHLLQRK